ncbi:unnamed protein product, partial [Rotaria magnacalcarata]
MVLMTDILTSKEIMVSHGAYLADDPSKSHEFTSLDDDVQIMLYCKAIMG